jgi:predicted dehydrogenase
MAQENKFNRREFITTAGAGAAGLVLANAIPVSAQTGQTAKRRYAIIGTGHRATSMWGVDIAKRYANEVEFVGLCDKNAKRAVAAKGLIGVECPTFTNFDEMCAKVKPDLLTVTTMDSTHVQFITAALAKGIDVITEKPMVTDAKQCQAVLDAEK